MLSYPRIGQPVRVHYRRELAAFMPLHGQVGVVVARAKGPGPRNHAVVIRGTEYFIPCGNLVKADTECPDDPLILEAPPVSAVRDRPRMGRKRTPPDPTSQEWWAKLGRLVDAKRKGRTNAEIAADAGLAENHFNLILRGEKPNASIGSIAAILRALPARWADFDRA